MTYRVILLVLLNWGLFQTFAMGQRDIQVTKLKEQYTDPKINFSDEYWKEHLTPLQYHVTREHGTEYPNTGLYTNFFEKGKYGCSNCKAILFDSKSKFHSGCGWPSFSDVADLKAINIIKDSSHGMIRTEITCALCGAHLGHVFEDGPPPLGLRYCINSASLIFLPEKK